MTRTEASIPERIQDAVLKPSKKKNEVYFTLPSYVVEGGSPGVVTVRFAYPLPIPFKFEVVAKPKKLVSAPKTVVMGAGKTSLSFKFTVKDDKITCLNRLVGIELYGVDYNFYASNVTRLFDDESPPTITMTLPTEFKEGDSTKQIGTITLNHSLTQDGFIDLVQSPLDQLDMPNQILVRAGKTQVKIPMSAKDDSKIDGDLAVSVFAMVGTRKMAKRQVKVLDNETSQLNLTLPANLVEGTKGNGTVSISGSLRKDLVVTLSDANHPSLKLPDTVIILAGETSATFAFSSPDNKLRDGSRRITVSAKAEKFTSIIHELVVLDNDLGSYRISGFDRILDPSVPLKITVTAIDVEGNVIAGFSGTVNLNAIMAGGASMSLAPSVVMLKAGLWTGNVTVPATASLITGLGVSDTLGVKGSTVDFDTLRTLDLKPADMLWDDTHHRILASIPANSTGARANQVVAINPESLQITGSIAIGQDPFKMAMTSGGEYLYVSLKTNGTIAKIDPATMTVISTFAVGSEETMGALYAADLEAVNGQPDLIVATRQPILAGAVRNTVAVYDNGIARAAATPIIDGFDFLLPSADPTVFFDLNSRYSDNLYESNRLLKLNANGVAEVEGSMNSVKFTSLSTNERSAGNTIYFPNGGAALDGLTMKKFAKYSIGGPICPDMDGNRIFWMELSSADNFTASRIVAYDPSTQNLIRQLALPKITEDVHNFMRWGKNGLAYTTAAGITLVHSPRLVPSGATAALATTIGELPNPVSVGGSVTFKINVTNHGPDIARDAFLSTGFTGAVTIKSASATKGFYEIKGEGISFAMGDLPVGLSASFNITVSSAVAGSVVCNAIPGSDAIDPDFSNSAASRLVNFGYRTGTDVTNKIGLVVNSQVYDPKRNLIWVTVPAFDRHFNPPRRVDPPFSRSVVSIDPRTGWVSDPIALGGDPCSRSMNLSANGRYLYAGIQNAGEVCRIDLEANPVEILRINLPINPYGWTYDAGAIEVLDGDGTSILLTSSAGESVTVIDGITPRPVQVIENAGMGIDEVRELRRTSDPQLFIGYAQNKLCQLSLASDGVRVTRRREQPYGVRPGTLGDGELWLWGKVLMFVEGLGEKFDLIPWGIYQASVYDAANHKVFVVGEKTIQGFDALTCSSFGSFKLADYDWEIGADSFARWGSDGFSIVNYDGMIVGRWSLAAPVVSPKLAKYMSGILPVDFTIDADSDGIPDVFENLYGTSPTQFNANPLKLSTVTTNEQTVIHVTFPRRAGIVMPAYGYEISSDLAIWSPVGSVSESVLSTQVVDGVVIDNVDAAITAPQLKSGFVRLKWMQN